MPTPDNIADFLVISAGRVGTISAYSELNRHADLQVFLTSKWHSNRVAEERARAPGRRIGIMCHENIDIEGRPETLATLADWTTRQAIVHLVRDPLVHVRARYNQLVWDTAYTLAYAERAEDRLGATAASDTALPIEDIATYILRSEWPEVRYYSYRRLFGQFERSITVDFTELKPGPPLEHTFRRVFKTIGVDPARAAKSLPFASGSNLCRTLTITANNRFVFRERIEGFEVDGYLTLAAQGIKHDPEAMLSIGICCRLPWYADAIGLEASGQEIWFCLDRASLERVPPESRRAVCLAAGDLVERDWARAHAQLVQRTVALYDAHKFDELPPELENYLRDLFTDDVMAMYAEHPRLRNCWTF
jgi:hypothetical protein